MRRIAKIWSRTPIRLGLEGVIAALALLAILYIALPRYQSMRVRVRASAVSGSGVVDQEVAKLVDGKLIYQVPQTMQLREPHTIQLLLGVQQSFDQLRHMIETKGLENHERIKVSDRMGADLTGSGSAFTIHRLVGGKNVGVSHLNPTEWMWSVIPKETGRHELYLTLYALVTVDGEPTSIEVMHPIVRMVQVKVTLGRRIALFLEAPPGWASLIVATGLLGFFVKWLCRKLSIVFGRWRPNWCGRRKIGGEAHAQGGTEGSENSRGPSQMLVSCARGPGDSEVDTARDASSEPPTS